jgi:hypothetical protein
VDLRAGSIVTGFVENLTQSKVVVAHHLISQVQHTCLGLRYRVSDGGTKTTTNTTAVVTGRKANGALAKESVMYRPITMAALWRTCRAVSAANGSAYQGSAC